MEFQIKLPIKNLIFESLIVRKKFCRVVRQSGSGDGDDKRSNNYKS